MGQINGNAAVKLCKRLWRFCRIILHGRQKGRCNGLRVSYTPPDKKKSPASVDARQKKSPASVGGVENFISAIQSNALCASILLTYNPR